jgi:hypothetical protein
LFTYSASAQNSSLMAGGSTKIIIYDFLGFTGVTAQPIDWSFSSELVTSPQPPLQSVPDNGAIVNLVWTYTGSTVQVGPLPALAINLGLFQAQSTIEVGSLGYYSTGDRDYGTLGSPGPESGASGRVNTPGVPDGGTTVMLLGVALSGLGLIRRKLVS